MGHGTRQESIAMEVLGLEMGWEVGCTILYIRTYFTAHHHEGKESNGKLLDKNSAWRFGCGIWIILLLTSQQASFLGIFDIPYLHVRC